MGGICVLLVSVYITRHRKLNQQPKFKSWVKLFAFPFMLITPGKGMNPSHLFLMDS